MSKLPRSMHAVCKFSRSRARKIHMRQKDARRAPDMHGAPTWGHKKTGRAFLEHAGDLDIYHPSKTCVPTPQGKALTTSGNRGGAHGMVVKRIIGASMRCAAFKQAKSVTDIRACSENASRLLVTAPYLTLALNKPRAN
eukprot:1161656-Pelagomonas_calceolata.AAC.4